MIIVSGFGRVGPLAGANQSDRGRSCDEMHFRNDDCWGERIFLSFFLSFSSSFFSIFLVVFKGAPSSPSNFDSSISEKVS